MTKEQMTRRKTIKKVLKDIYAEYTSPEWIPVDWEKYPEGYPRPFQEVWITDEYNRVFHMSYNGKRRIKAWMPFIAPEPYEAENE